MATLAIQGGSPSGLVPVFTAASAGGDLYPAGNGHVALHVNNGGGAPCNVTVVAVRRCDQGFLHPIVVTVVSGTRELIGPQNPVIYLDPGTQLYSVTYDQVVGVTVAAVQM